jgi:hypothetical protein
MVDVHPAMAHRIELLSVGTEETGKIGKDLSGDYRKPNSDMMLGCKIMQPVQALRRLKRVIIAHPEFCRQTGIDPAIEFASRGIPHFVALDFCHCRA